MQTIAHTAEIELGSARANWVQLETRNDWELVRPLGGVLIIADAGGASYHGPGCVLAGPSMFQESVVERRAAGLEADVSVFWAARPWCAEEGGARRCDHADDPLAVR
jgi:hypothetical protein